ncbi:aminoglycoside phosphotransferase family protein [Actinopolymorpha sp. B17G11]|uniref:phosphotransferase family protein n=1 Tax=unclassified Actinopolymorpha TaxID=2627063 RepID=UPI0032D8BE97
MHDTGSSTHDVTIRADIVIKRFRSWSRGEHRREWAGLTLLAAHLPGLAPRPIRADLTGVPPTVVMSRLAAEPLGSSLLTSAQIDALAAAVGRLHRAIPACELAKLPRRIGHPAALVGQVAHSIASPPQLGTDPLVRQAYDMGSAWIHQLSADVVEADPPPVFGLADGNLANYLWDGTQVMMVDFEDSGRSDRAYEVAELVEHLSAWIGDAMDVPALLTAFDLAPVELARLGELRRLCAFVWLLMLLPGGPAHARNPIGTTRRQAERLLTLLS